MCQTGKTHRVRGPTNLYFFSRVSRCWPFVRTALSAEPAETFCFSLVCCLTLRFPRTGPVRRSGVSAPPPPTVAGAPPLRAPALRNIPGHTPATAAFGAIVLRPVALLEPVRRDSQIIFLSPETATVTRNMLWPYVRRNLHSNTIQHVSGRSRICSRSDVASRKCQRP